MRKNYLLVVMQIAFFTVNAQFPQKMEEKLHYIMTDSLLLNPENNENHLILFEDQMQRSPLPEDDYLLKSSVSNLQLDSMVSSIFISELDSVPFQKTIWSHNDLGKLTTINIYNGDSINKVWVPERKVEYKYDSQGNMIYHDWRDWDAIDSTYSFTGKYEWEYDADGNVVYHTYSPGNTEKDGWAPGWTRQYDYDEQSNETLFIYFSWDNINKVWKGERNEMSEYDSQGNRTLYLIYVWDRTNQVWVSSYKQEWEFYSYDKIMHYASYRFENGVWVGGLKEEHVYDELGNLTFQSTTNIWNHEKAEWINSWKTEYIYHPLGHMTLPDATYTWDQSEESWVIYKTNEYEFDPNGNMILHIESLESINDEWTSRSRYEWEYDPEGNNNLYTWYRWDNDLAEWVRISKFESEYDSRGNMVLYKIYEWETYEETWLNVTIKEWEYNDPGYLSSYSTSTWDRINEQWTEDYKNIRELDEQGNTTSQVYYRDNGLSKMEYKYNAVGVILYASYYRTSVNEDWVGIVKHENEYNSFGLTTYNCNYIWDNDNGDWIYERKNESEYYSDGKLYTSAQYIWNTLDSRWAGQGNKVVREYKMQDELTLAAYYGWNDDTEDWDIEKKNYYYYSDVVTHAAKPDKNSTITLYPNPANGIIYFNGIENANVSIFNTLGRQVLNIDNVSGTIDVSRLPNSIYIIRIIENGQTTRLKFVKN